ncbi:hypothetical protein N480_09740 [Pseudoalteromonas luteoviolacea S2607]|uniref:hypothetical protein n=1 Tax=Pseudoalteromonas luteoviolacea TaxID=43657 RepID=UPI0007B0A3CE|nr:hypothetical protein [Pseudoalteromonas luteoviolacea]KZN29040.1 hypothetical protein N480_09740 [Pseudoalteromonas luteoviolacea S2607]
MSQITITLNDLVLPRKGMKAAISEPHVIIYIDKQLDRVYAMDMTRDKKPTLLSYEKLILELESGDLTKGELDLPDYMKKSDKFIKPSQLSKRDKKFQIIKPILYDLETFLVSRNYGNRKISNCLEVAKNVGLKATRTQLYEWLYRYFRTGCNINAFLRKPGTGKSLEKKYTKKTGPKRASGVIGRMRNEIDDKHITKIVNQHIKCRNPKSIPAAFIEYEDTFASDPTVNAITGEITGYKRWDEEKRISEGQFKSYARELIKKILKVLELLRVKLTNLIKIKRVFLVISINFTPKGLGTLIKLMKHLWILN